MKRTPLKRLAPLRSSDQLRRLTRLHPVSAKRKRDNLIRRARAMEKFGRNPLCARCGRMADDLHELLSRARGGSITNMSNCVPLCRRCHTAITDHTCEDWAQWTESSHD